MAATIQIHEITINATTGVDKTSGTVRFKAANDTNVDTNDPLRIPAAGTIYSFTKILRPYMEAPPDTEVSNLQWYSDGSNDYGTGVGVTAKNNGTTFTAQYDTAQVGGADLFSYTSGSPLDGDATDTGPFGPGDDNSHIGDMIELQMSVASTAAGGILTAEPWTLSYDEI